MAEFGLSPLTMVLLPLAFAAAGVAALRHWDEVLPRAPPTARSLHERPMPRVGGLAIWAGFVPIAVVGPQVPGIATPAWVGAWLAVVTVSLIDDWRGVHPIPRLAVHGIAALTAAAALCASTAVAGVTASWLLEVVLLALLIAWSANLFNFMDGNDGLAAMMSVCGFGAYAIAASIAGSPIETYAAIAAATLPFLAVNLPPARMFMGDVGAVPLGFLAAVFGIAGWREGTWPGWFPLLVFLPFVVDATATLFLRVLRAERVWEAHRTHYYQRLHQLGALHGGTLAAYCGLMVGTAATALALLVQRPASGWWGLAAWTAIIGAFFTRIDYHWKQKKTNSP